MSAMRARPRAATLTAFIACQVIVSIPLAGVAAAHVKWFVTCEPSNNPVPLRVVLTERLLLFSALFISVFYVACKIEQSAIGGFLMNLLERATTFLRERLDFLLRAVAAISFPCCGWTAPSFWHRS